MYSCASSVELTIISEGLETILSSIPICTTVADTEADLVIKIVDGCPEPVMNMDEEGKVDEDTVDNGEEVLSGVSPGTWNSEDITIADSVAVLDGAELSNDVADRIGSEVALYAGKVGDKEIIHGAVGVVEIELDAEVGEIFAGQDGDVVIKLDTVLKIEVSSGEEETVEVSIGDTGESCFVWDGDRDIETLGHVDALVEGLERSVGVSNSEIRGTELLGEIVSPPVATEPKDI